MSFLYGDIILIDKNKDLLCEEHCPMGKVHVM